MKILGEAARRIDAVCRRPVRLATARPRTMLALWCLLTLLPLGGLLRLERDTDGQAMVPRGAEAIRIDREVRALFGRRDPLLVVFETGRPGGVFEPAVLAAVRQVSDALIALPEIGRDHVTSLGTEARPRLFPGWSETYGDFLTPLPESPAQLAELREDLARPAARLLYGTVLTRDAGATAIAAGVPAHGEVDREAVVRQVEALVAPLRRPGLAIEVVGAPAAEATLATYILRDLALLVPLSMAVIAFVLWLGTRRLVPVGLAVAKVGAAIAFTFGVLGWLGVPVFLTVAIVPVVLAAMCIADEVHVLMRFQRLLDAGRAPRAAVHETFETLATPVVAATLTTCIGFLACLPSRIAPVQALGGAAALGIAYSLAFTLCVTPALLVLLPERWLRRPAGRDVSGAVLAACGRLAAPALARPALTLGVLAAVTLLAVPGALAVAVQDSWIDNFARDSTFRRATERVNERLFGVHRLDVHLAFPEAGAFESAPVLAAVAAFERGLAERADVGGVLGPWAQMATVADFWNLGEAFRRDEEAATVLARFDFAPGRTRRRQVVADGSADGVVTVFLEGANYRDTARVMAAARELHGQFLAPFGASLRFAGDVAVSQAMIPAVVRNQVLSLPLALAGVAVMVVLLAGSVRLAVYAILPVAVSGLWLLGILGAAGIPLGVATSMFFVIALGLGVDSHSIHFVMRYRQVPDVRTALDDVAAPIVLNTLAVTAGFGLLAFSSVPANRNLGLLIAAGLLLGCALTLTGVAALLALRPVRRPQPRHSFRLDVEDLSQQVLPKEGL